MKLPASGTMDTSLPISGPVGVAIIEDHREFREYLAALINGTEGLKCTGRFRSVEDALARIAEDLPDVVLIDIGLPGMSGIEGIGVLKERHPTILLLTLTVYDDDERIFDALCAGASGYLLKKTQPARLVESVKEAAQGGAPMSPEVARRVIRLFRQIRPPERAEHNLTPHEGRFHKGVQRDQNKKTPRTQAGGRIHHDQLSPAKHLSETASSLQNRSRCQSPAKPPHLIRRPNRNRAGGSNYCETSR